MHKVRCRGWRVHLSAIHSTVLRVDIRLKFLLHWEHLYGFSAVGILWCLLRLHIWIKAFPHWEHGCGFSPVCVIWCFGEVRATPGILSTCSTLICLLPSMDPKVFLERRQLIKGLSTMRTMIGLFPCMDPHVCLEVRCDIEGLPACTALVWLFPRIPSLPRTSEIHHMVIPVER